jgi:predicted transcriptional regulator
MKVAMQGYLGSYLNILYSCVFYLHTDKGGNMKATTVRLEDSIIGRVDHLASELSRSRSWVIKQAIERFLDYEEWFVQEVKDGLSEVERGDIATDKEVADKFRKWGVDAS